MFLKTIWWGVSLKVKYIIFLIILLLTTVNAQQYQKIFTLDVVIYRNNSVELKEFGIEEGKVSFFGDIGSYSIRLISFNGSVTFQKPLNIEFVIYPEPGISEGIQLNEIELYLRLPFSQETKKVQILHDNKIIFDFNTENYLCNKDNLCAGYENKINCPEDCLKKPKYSLFIVLAAILVAIAFIFVMVYRKYRH